MDKQTYLATKTFAFDGRTISAGQSFQAMHRDADLLKLAGLAVDPPSHETRDLAPDPDQADKPKRRQYRRRDMTPDA